MKIAIMQPTFLPWIGYFKLINQADLFIFLDDVQYSKGSWHNRNRILINNNITWITVPVKKNKLNTNINNTLIDNSKRWKETIISKISSAYQKENLRKNIEFITDLINDIYTQNICELNISLIKAISKKLELKTRFEISSQLNIDLPRSEKLLKICNIFNATEYISPIGSKEYIENDNKLGNSNINLKYFDYTPKKYMQNNFNEFISHLSIIDLIANIGIKKSIEFIES